MAVILFCIFTGIIAIAAHMAFGTLFLIWLCGYVFLRLMWEWYE
jgi:hypothetical protein